MKIKSAKAKGRNLQNLVRDKLRSIFVGKALEEDDIKSQTMGMSGEDIERLNLWKSLDQCESNCEDRNPVLVIKRNRSEVYAIIKFDKFLNLIEEKQ
jgi:hypothetical protein